MPGCVQNMRVCMRRCVRSCMCASVQSMHACILILRLGVCAFKTCVCVCAFKTCVCVFNTSLMILLNPTSSLSINLTKQSLACMLEMLQYSFIIKLDMILVVCHFFRYIAQIVCFPPCIHVGLLQRVGFKAAYLIV